MSLRPFRRSPFLYLLFYKTSHVAWRNTAWRVRHLYFNRKFNSTTRSNIWDALCGPCVIVTLIVPAPSPPPAPLCGKSALDFCEWPVKVPQGNKMSPAQKIPAEDLAPGSTRKGALSIRILNPKHLQNGVTQYLASRFALTSLDSCGIYQSIHLSLSLFLCLSRLTISLWDTAIAVVNL